MLTINKTNNNLSLTNYVTILCIVACAIFLDFSILGFICGVLYGQIIEWFVHGWIQHHPFKIFKAYRDNHTYHHKYPFRPIAVQPVTYFVIGSIALLAPFYWFPGFFLGYFFIYLNINVIHHDLHSERKILPLWLWNTKLFQLITSHHEAHHKGRKLPYTTHSVTNPYLDMVFTKIRLHSVNNWIAKHLKI